MTMCDIWLDNLMYGVKNAFYDEAKNAIMEGADLHHNNDEPLFEAASRGYINITDMLVRLAKELDKPYTKEAVEKSNELIDSYYTMSKPIKK